MNPGAPGRLVATALSLRERPFVLGLPRLKGNVLPFAPSTPCRALAASSISRARLDQCSESASGTPGTRNENLVFSVRLRAKFQVRLPAPSGNRRRDFFGGEQRPGVYRAKAPISPLCRVEARQ